MQSTNSSFKTIVRENLAMYWPIPVLSLVAYMIVGMMPVILNYRAFEDVSFFSYSFMTGSSFMVNAIIAVSAISASMAAFWYLHNPTSALSMHAMPINRRRLFTASAFSGWLFVIMPLIIIAFLMLTLRGAVTGPGQGEMAEAFSLGYPGSAREIFTLSHSLLFIIKTIVTATNVYAICCFAAVLSGMGNIHGLLSMFLIVLPNFLIGQIEALCKDYLYGFAGFDIDYSHISALTYAMNNEEFKLEPTWMIIYLIIAIAIMLISYIIYRHVRIERIGQATTFPVVGDILCIILTFMCGFGIAQGISLFTAGSDEMFVPAGKFALIVFITSVVCYLVMRMIADSTLAVFNLTTLKKFGVYFVIAAIFVMFVVLDVTGYGGKVSAPGDVESVHLNTNFPQGRTATDYDFSDPAEIETLIDLQTAIVDERPYGLEDETYADAFNITWHLRDGKTYRRSYDVSYGGKNDKVDGALRKLYDMPGFRDKLQSVDVDGVLSKAASIEICRDGVEDEDLYEGEYKPINHADWRGLLEAMDADYRARTYDDMVAEGYDTTVYIKYKDEIASSDHYDGEDHYITGNDTNTMKFLKDHGYI